MSLSESESESESDENENHEHRSIRIVIVGGVAGGASAAARARRLDENASIVVFERGHEASFANCGLPYYLGGEIASRDQLLVAGDRQLKQWLNLDVRIRSEVAQIDRAAREVVVRELNTGRAYREPYDYCVLATGAAPIRPEKLLENVGADHPRVISLRNMADVDRMKAIVDDGVKLAVVIGGGFIGLEVAEQLRRRHVETKLVEMLPQVMPPFDAEMVEPIHRELASHGVRAHLNDGVAGLERVDDRVRVRLNSGTEFVADLVLLAIGVRPDAALADAAGLVMTNRGAIQVDDRHRTSDPRIFAVGDVVEVDEPILGGRAFVPLGGPANRQGRLVADGIATLEGGGAFSRDQLRYRGTQGTSIVRVFDVAAAMTGMSEKALARLEKRRGEHFGVVYAHPNCHAGYFPGATPIALKLIYEIPTGRILGAQATGRHGIDKRIDVIAMAIQKQATVFDLAEAELCYAPPFGSAKDPVNIVGFMAANALQGLTRPVHVDTLPNTAGRENANAEASPLLVDVRTTIEFEVGSIPGARHVPLEQLRDRLHELPKERPIVTYCKSGQRGYFAERILRQNGFQDVGNLSGGFETWKQFHPDHSAPAEVTTNEPLATVPVAEQDRPSSESVEQLDARGLQCPGPLMAVAERVSAAPKSARIRVLASDPGFPKDVAAWCKSRGHTLLEAGPENGHFAATIVTANTNGPDQPSRTQVHTTPPGNGQPLTKGQTIVVFSGDLDRVLASFVIANGAAAMGHPVTMFFTFWGLNALRKAHAAPVNKSWLDRMFGWMMPRGADRLKLSQMHMGGLGTAMMKHVMRTKGVASLPHLMQAAQRQGVRMVACTMSMDVMGIQAEELIDGLEFAGVGAYIGDAQDSSMNLFV